MLSLNSKSSNYNLSYDNNYHFFYAKKFSKKAFDVSDCDPSAMFGSIAFC